MHVHILSPVIILLFFVLIWNIKPARLAQLVEQQTVMQQVPGSIPAPDSTWLGVDSALHPSVGRENEYQQT